MGRVYEAEHIEIGKRVALKILHPGYSQTPDLVERLRREARAASRIGHPNVVDVTDSGTTDDGAFFFVMEYLEGRELGDVVFEEKGIDVRRAVGIAVQICRACAPRTLPASFTATSSPRTCCWSSATARRTS